MGKFSGTAGAWKNLPDGQTDDDYRGHNGFVASDWLADPSQPHRVFGAATMGDLPGLASVGAKFRTGNPGIVKRESGA